MKNKPLSYCITYYGTYATFVLVAVFLVLRLTRVIDWSWWWVISPIMLPFGVSLVVVIISLILLKKYRR